MLAVDGWVDQVTSLGREGMYDLIKRGYVALFICQIYVLWPVFLNLLGKMSGLETVHVSCYSVDEWRLDLHGNFPREIDSRGASSIKPAQSMNSVSV